MGNTPSFVMMRPLVGLDELETLRILCEGSSCVVRYVLFHSVRIVIRDHEFTFQATHLTINLTLKVEEGEALHSFRKYIISKHKLLFVQHPILQSNNLRTPHTAFYRA
jgi:hypothetical protein